MKKTILKITVLALIASLLLAACSSDDKNEDSTTTTTAAKNEKTLVEVAQEDPQFSTLVGLVNDAGLAALLQLDGSYTVFAPNDDAFEALGEGKLEAVKSNPDQLRAVLTYHAIATKVLKSDDLKDGDKLETVSGAILTVGRQGDKITLTSDAGQTVNIVKADITASNGVVHAIDGVLIPASAAGN